MIRIKWGFRWKMKAASRFPRRKKAFKEMTRAEIERRFPNASETFIRANLSFENSGIRPAEHCKQKAAMVSGGEGKTQGGECPVVRITVRRKRLLDVDAKYAAVKHLLDGVVATGLVAGDKEGQISLECPQIKCGRGEPEETLIEIFKKI